MLMWAWFLTELYTQLKGSLLMDMEITFPGGLKVDALYKDFTIHTDQSKEDGGDTSAPAPFDLFLVSIATCAGIYVLRFCQKRNIDTQGLKLFFKKDLDNEFKMISKITIEIQLPPEFPEKYHAAVIKAANLCSVKKHIINPPDFQIQIKK